MGWDGVKVVLGLRLEIGVKLSGVRLDWTGPRVSVEVELGLGWVAFRAGVRLVIASRVGLNCAWSRSRFPVGLE